VEVRHQRTAAADPVPERAAMVDRPPLRLVEAGAAFGQPAVDHIGVQVAHDPIGLLPPTAELVAEIDDRCFFVSAVPGQKWIDQRLGGSLAGTAAPRFFCHEDELPYLEFWWLSLTVSYLTDFS